MIIAPTSIKSIREIIETVRSVYNYRLDYYTHSSLCLAMERFCMDNRLESIEKLSERLATNNKDLFDNLIAKLQVDSKELFRSPAVWRAIKELKTSNVSFGPNTRIWLPDVGDGAELYTIIIHLFEQDLLKNVKITVSAKNNIILNTIKSGVLNQKSIQLGIDNYNRYKGLGNLESFFINENGIKSFDTKHLKGVEFKVDDIFRSEIKKHFDLVFFRNRMLLYNKTKTKVLENVITSMKPGGILFIGEKEKVELQPNKLRVLNKKENIYKKYI